MRTSAATIAAIVLAVAAPCAAEEFHLSCSGTSNALATSTTFGSAHEDFGPGSVSGQATTYSRRETSDRLLLEIDDSGARIRLPASLVPPVHNGGKDGWWPLTEVAVTETEVTGKFAVNLVNRGRVRIDRRTGDINIGQLGSGFRGQCEKFEPEARKF